MNDEILRGTIILLSLGKFVIPPLIIGCIWEEYDKRRRKKADRQRAKRKAQYELDCEFAGRRMHHTDEIMRTVNEFAKQQKITCKGYFSGAAVERYIKQV